MVIAAIRTSGASYHLIALHGSENPIKQKLGLMQTGNFGIDIHVSQASAG